MTDTTPNSAATTKLLVAQDFEPHLGAIFRFLGTPFALPLTKIILGPENPFAALERRGFILIFRSPKQAEFMAEGSYVCEIEGGPSHELYVMPIFTPDPRRQDYQASFN